MTNRTSAPGGTDPVAEQADWRLTESLNVCLDHQGVAQAEPSER
jgi:hypothetical protein